MPQVPYVPYSRVEPAADAGTPYNPDRGNSPEAFGAGVGQAIGQLGTRVEQFSDVLAKHEFQFAQRQNQMAALDIANQQMIKIANLDGYMQTLEGKARVDAMPEYQKKLVAIWQEGRKATTNPDMTYLYDNDIKKRVGYSIQNEAIKAGTALKQYNLGVANAREGLALSNAAANAQDDKAFEVSLDDVRRASELRAKSHYWEPDSPEAQIDLQQGISKAWHTRLSYLATVDPKRAEVLFEKNREQMDGVTALAVEKTINQGKVQIGTRVDANRVWDSLSIGGPANIHTGQIVPVKTTSGKTVQVNSQAKAAFEGFLGDLEATGYKIHDIGGYNVRNIAGTTTPSQHSYGLAIDINPDQNPDTGRGGRLITDLPPNVSELATKWGLRWGGDFKSKKDSMHFEYVGRPDEVDTVINNDPQTKLQKALAMVPELAAKAAPNDEGLQAQYADTLISRFNVKAGLDHKLETDLRRSQIQLVLSEIGFGPDGKKSPEELSPQAQQILADNPLLGRSVNAQMRRNATADVPETEERRAHFREIMGQSITNPQAFLDLKVSDLDMTRSQQNQIFKRQLAITKKVQDNNLVNEGLRTVGGLLREAGIHQDSSDRSAQARYNQFAGAFEVELARTQGADKKRPDQARQKQIATQLLRELAGTGWFVNDRAFEVPQKFIDETTPRFRARYGTDPTNADLYRLYQIEQRNQGK